MDAVVNLAGATTGKIPWTKKYMRELIDSRIDSTRALVEAMRTRMSLSDAILSSP